MRHIVFISLMLVSVGVSGQRQNVDSLVNVLETQELSSAEQLDLYENISKFYMTNDLEKGFEYASKGLILAKKEKDRKKLSTFYRFLGAIYYYQSKFDTSRMHLDKALSLAKEIDDKPLQVITYSEFGNSYFLQNNYQSALEYYMQGLALNDSKPDRSTAVILVNMANIHRTLNNPDRAISFNEQALEIAEQLDLDDLRMSVYSGLGLIYADKGEPDKAIEYNLKALGLSRELGRKPHEMSILTALSAQFCVKKEYDEALRYIHEALQIGEKFGSTRDMTNILSVMSEIYLNMECYEKCETIALRAWDIDSVSYMTASPTALTLCVAYIHLGEKEKAEYFVRKFFAISVENNNKSLHDSLSDMEVKYETEKKEMRITALEKERQLYIWLGVAGILLVIALGIVLWQMVRNARKEKQLISTRSVLDGEMSERSRLARDLHDRLSGNLSAIKISLNDSRNTMQNVYDRLDGCIEEIRRVAHNLMPASLQFGMKVALGDFAAQFSDVHFHFFGTEKRIGERVEFVIYCCANELVNNSIKHSGAKSINLQLVQTDKYVTLTVSDDGCGFDEKTVEKGFGLKSIRDRVTSCNGNIDIVTSAGVGTEITIEIKTENTW